MVMPSPTVPVPLEIAAMIGAFGSCGIDHDIERRRGGTGVADRIGGPGGKPWAPSASVAVAKLQAPLALAVTLPSSVVPS